MITKPRKYEYLSIPKEEDIYPSPFPLLASHFEISSISKFNLQKTDNFFGGSRHYKPQIKNILSIIDTRNIPCLVTGDSTRLIVQNNLVPQETSEESRIVCPTSFSQIHNSFSHTSSERTFDVYDIMFL
ncbi:hypothetical protein AYI70_g8278 [Smittium culicis]|uniref:Uncharacterized protein n=1 Tax=Smittium culicis TaxID=133412 RepID=A0A1R1XGT4_9FUNG|nr:hypothetical protein AYI70_g8278 [Smittium culicis]